MRNDMVKEFENIKAVRSLRTARHPEPEGWSEPIHDALIAGRACSVHFINDDEGKGIFKETSAAPRSWQASASWQNKVALRRFFISGKQPEGTCGISQNNTETLQSLPRNLLSVNNEEHAEALGMSAFSVSRAWAEGVR